jgi:hypothetical protein
MYSKQESSRLRQEFWTTFGQYMNPLKSAEGEKINWINYKTGERDVFFRMEADGKTASLSIEIRHKDALIRQIFYDHFLSLENIFSTMINGNWKWSPDSVDEHGKPLGRISLTLEHVNVFNKEDWPQMIRFFKSGIIELDQFWNEVKFSFELLH